METVKSSISNETLKNMSMNMFDNLVKAVVDVEQEIMIVDAGLHADEETFLLENGSQQEHLWGINLYPEHFGTENFIVFDSMINLRPRQGNRTRGVDNPTIQAAIRRIVLKLVTP